MTPRGGAFCREDADMYAGRSAKYGGLLTGAQISPCGRRKLIKINQKFILHANSINQRSRDPVDVDLENLMIWPKFGN